MNNNSFLYTTIIAGSCIVLLGALRAVHTAEAFKGAGTQAAPRAAMAWPRSGHDSQNTKRGGGRGSRGTLLWRYDTGGPLFDAAPIVGLNGIIYVGTSHNALLALDGRTGQPLSSVQFKSETRNVVQFGGGQTKFTFYAPAQAADGTLCASAADNKVYTFDGQTGAQEWQFQEAQTSGSAPTFSADGRLVYVGGRDWEVYALDRRVGKKVWGFRTGGNIEDSLAVGPDGTVYACSRDGNVYALDGQTGKRRWQFESTEVFHAGPCLAPDGMLYVVNKAGRVYGLNSRTGKACWTYKVKGLVFNSPALGADGTVCVGGDRLYALDAHTGRVRWVCPIRGDVTFHFSSPAVSGDGTIYVGATGQNLYAIDGRSGQPLWTFHCSGEVDTSPAIGADGTVYIGSWDGYLYAIH